MIRKIIYLSKSSASITGGHKYNNDLIAYIKAFSDVAIEYRDNPSQIYKGYKRLFAPFVELKELKNFNRRSLVFFSDTSYKYHFLLLLLTKFFSKAETLIIIHHFPFLNERGYFNRMLQKCYFSLVDHILIPSPYTLDVAKKFISDFKLNYIPLPFEKEVQFSEIYQIGNLLYVGTIERRKGIIYMLRAVKKLIETTPIVRLDIVGKIVDDEYYNELKNFLTLNHLEDYVEFHGRISNEKLNEFYTKAEIFVFPSLLEGYGIVLIEAMKYGLPIVAFNNSAIPYTIINQHNGFIVKNKNSDEMAMTLNKIIGNIQERNRIQKGIQETIAGLKDFGDFYRSIDKFWCKINSEK